MEKMYRFESIDQLDQFVDSAAEAGYEVHWDRVRCVARYDGGTEEDYRVLDKLAEED